LISIWDCDIDAVYPEPFMVDLDIRVGDHAIRTTYGVVKEDTQSSGSISRIVEYAGWSIVVLQEEGERFHIQCRKAMG